MRESRPEVIKFVLLTTQRTGSTFIRLWLNSHPNLRCHSEIFFRRYRAADGFKSYCEANLGRRLLYYTLGRRRFTELPYNFGMKWMIERFLHELYDNPSFSAPWTDMTTEAWWKEYRPRGNSDLEKAVGFQLMYGQLADYRPLQEWIANPNVYIIHLIRWNALKLLLSRIVARKTGQYHFAGNGSRQKVSLDPEKILTQLDRIVIVQEEMKNFPDNPYLEITYERFFSDPDYIEESEKILSFLKIEKAKMEFPTFLKKLNPDSLEDLIENYDEIAVILKGTPYQKFLS